MKGKALLKCMAKKESKNWIASDVLYIPSLTANLLSIPTLIKKSYTIKFKSEKCTVSINREVYFTRHLEKGLVHLNCKKTNTANAANNSMGKKHLFGTMLWA